jgi:hypothetical protein
LELVWQVYEEALDIRLVEPRGLGTWDLSHPKVQTIVKQRYPQGVPVDEPAVAPVQLMESSWLEVVHVR